MASDISASSYDLSERDNQLSLSSEEEVQAVESPKKERMKKLPSGTAMEVTIILKVTSWRLN